MVDVEAELAKDNPKTSAVTIRLYADALRTYVEASASVRLRGSVVMHPRTGSPIDNPHLKVMERAGAQLAKMPRVKADRVLQLLEAE